jgi:membrane-associated phospholipid phosphatase
LGYDIICKDWRSECNGSYRPDVLDTDPFCGLARIIYSHDNPYNAFPSIHVLGTFSLILAATMARKIGKITKLGIVVVGLLIILSTVFVKQHVVLDILAGLIFASGFYLLNRKLLARFLASQPE